MQAIKKQEELTHAGGNIEGISSYDEEYKSYDNLVRPTKFISKALDKVAEQRDFKTTIKSSFVAPDAASLKPPVI